MRVFFIASVYTVLYPLNALEFNSHPACYYFPTTNSSSYTYIVIQQSSIVIKSSSNICTYLHIFVLPTPIHPCVYPLSPLSALHSIICHISVNRRHDPCCHDSVADSYVGCIGQDVSRFLGSWWFLTSSSSFISLSRDTCTHSTTLPL